MLPRVGQRRLVVFVCVLASFCSAALHVGSGQRGITAAAAGLPAHSESVPARQTDGTAVSAIQVDYPEAGSIFPPEITPPTFIWHDASAAHSWRIAIDFSDAGKPIELVASGEPPKIGAIDARCVSSTNRLPELTPEQASAAHTWKPDADTWVRIKQHSPGKAAKVIITGVGTGGNAGAQVLSQGQTTITTSTDPVAAPIFYRDVPLMPSEGRKGVVQPLSPSLLYLINWRIRDLSQPESRVVLHDMHTCGNCHSFSNDGKTMGMDIDGPGNDKGLYAIVPVQKEMSIATKDMLSWNADLRVGQARVGFMSQVSPDGRYVLSTFAGQDQTIGTSYFVTNFNDYRFLQVFYPTRGILAFYDRTTGKRQSLPGADDPRYVQTDGVWSPDGKYVVFARAEARDSDPPGHTEPLHANDPNEVQIQYSLYVVPFNNGKGGAPKPIAGASENGMSNSFPKVSPDGRWIVFVKCRNGQLMRPDSELYIVPFGGGTARRMRCNTRLMNSWHSFSPNGRWLVFSSKSRSPYTQMFLTHIDANGNDSPPIYIDNATAANRAVNIPEFVNIAPDGLQKIDVPAADFYRVVDEAIELESKGQLESALARWKDALAFDPDDARANNGTGVALGQLGRLGDAVLYFRKAAQLDSEFFEAWYNLGVVLMRENKMDEAIDAWQNAVRIRPQFAQGHENLGYALYRGGRYTEALAQLRRAVAEDPDRIMALTLEARLLATCPEGSIRNGAEALLLAERARGAKGGQRANVLDTLAAALAENQRFDEAVQAEENALELNASQHDAELAPRLKLHLEDYKAHQALHEPLDAAMF